MEEKKGNNIGSFLIGASIGALTMYFLDPQRGHARRILVRDKAFSLSRKTKRRIGQVASDLKNRSLGSLKEMQNRMKMKTGEISDDVKLEQRIRSSFGRKVSHARAIKVSSVNGSVTLSGPILQHEVDQLITCVQNVPGVKSVSDELEKYDQPGDISSLQGRGAEYFQ